MAYPEDNRVGKGSELNDKRHTSHLQAFMGRSVAGSSQQPRTQLEIPLPPPRAVQKIPTLHQRGMEFLHEKKDYNVAEFYEHFRDDLPKTVMINQGFCGEIVEDTFDREQVLRVNAISKQPRVVAKFQYGNNTRLISIPLSYEEKLCIVKHGGKHGKPKQMFTIIRENKLPITVQFPKDQEITVGSHTVSTNNIPCMELVESFEEVYLLANFITDGVMSQEVVHVPLYLSQLRLAIVTGIKGHPKEKFNSYQKELDQVALYIEFDQEFGNSNIAEYDPRAIHSDTTYTYVEPTAYSNFVSLVNKSPFRAFDSATYGKEEQNKDEGPNVYEEIDNTARGGLPVHGKYGNRKKSIDNTVHEDATPKLTSFQTHPQKPALPPPLAPKPHVTHTTLATDPSGSGPAPTVPERRAVPHVPKPPTGSSNSAHALYTNDVPRTTILPTFHNTEKKLKPEAEKEKNVVREVKSSDDVAKLNIEEVTHYMTRLKLGKYAEHFKNQLIDGAMLVDLDKDILKEDFDMKGVEALRLMKFAREGHVPN